jgi:Predicted methylated DNA-protein cysteine methyltransferase
MDIYKRIEYICLQIPYGRVATYGQIAMLCGVPNNSRQVGYALNKKIRNVEIPAHRVVNHKGELTGAEAFDTPHLQKQLLISEKIKVKENCVDLKLYGWKNSFDVAELFYQYFQENNI